MKTYKEQERFVGRALATAFPDGDVVEQPEKLS